MHRVHHRNKTIEILSTVSQAVLFGFAFSPKPFSLFINTMVLEPGFCKRWFFKALVLEKSSTTHLYTTITYLPE